MDGTNQPKVVQEVLADLKKHSLRLRRTCVRRLKNLQLWLFQPVLGRGDWSNQESLEPQIELDRKSRYWKVVLVEQ